MIDPTGMAADTTFWGGVLETVNVVGNKLSNFRWPTWTYHVPILGAAAQSGNNLADGNYVASLGNFGTALAELYTAGFFSEYKVGATMTNQTVSTVVKKSNRIFTIVDQEGDLIIYSTKVGDEVVTFGGNITKENGSLIIKNFDVDGNLTNMLGIRGLKEIIKDFGAQQGVQKVIIEGAKRTTGANPGKVPSQMIFNID